MDEEDIVAARSSSSSGSGVDQAHVGSLPLLSHLSDNNMHIFYARVETKELEVLCLSWNLNIMVLTQA